MAKNTKTSAAKDATVETAVTPASETVTNPNDVLDSLEAQGIPVSERMRNNAKSASKKADEKKAKKAKPVKLIGPFPELEIDKLVQKDDKKNPVSFKSWAKKHAVGYDNTSDMLRSAYDEDMAEYRAAHPFSKKELREILVASEVIAHPRKHTFKKIERSLVVLRKHKIINEAPTTAWVGGHNVHFQLTYTPLGRLTLGEQLGKKKMRKHLARTSVSGVSFATSDATH